MRLNEVDLAPGQEGRRPGGVGRSFEGREIGGDSLEIRLRGVLELRVDASSLSAVSPEEAAHSRGGDGRQLRWGIGRPLVRWGGGKLWAGPDVLPVALQGRSDAVAMEEVAVLVEGRARMILPAPFEPVPDVLGLGPEARPPGLEVLGLNGVLRGVDVAREPVAEVGDGAGVARIDRALEVLHGP